IGTWNVRSMNQGKLEVVKQEMARVNVNILGISELKWTGMGEFNSDDHYIYYRGQESLRRNGVAIMVNKRVQNAVLGCNLKNNRMISVHFQAKPFNITVIQDYAPISNAEEAEVEQFYEDLQDLLELTPKKDVLFIIGDWNARVESQETPGVTGKFGLGIQNEARQRLIEQEYWSGCHLLLQSMKVKSESEVAQSMEKTRDLFKKIRDTKGTFHAKMGSIKDR
ncbi:hypothetical protein M91_17522, partial [Bos mutus]